jgi:hypothetical protein
LQHLIVLATVWEAVDSPCRYVSDNDKSASGPATDLDDLVPAREISTLFNGVPDSGAKVFEFSIPPLEVRHCRSAAIDVIDRKPIERLVGGDRLDRSHDGGDRYDEAEAHGAAQETTSSISVRTFPYVTCYGLNQIAAFVANYTIPPYSLSHQDRPLVRQLLSSR